MVKSLAPLAPVDNIDVPVNSSKELRHLHLINKMQPRGNRSRRFSALPLALARLYFILNVWYAVLADAPLAVQNTFVLKLPLYHISEEFLLALHVPWLKISKDVLFLAALLCVIVVIASRGWILPVSIRSNIVVAFILLLVIVVGLAGISFITNGVWVSLIGLRAHLALLSMILGWHVGTRGLKWIWFWIKPLLFVQLFFAIVQYFGVFTTNVSRSVGTFYNPNTLGIFVVVIQFLALIVEKRRWARWLYWGIGMFVVFLSGSRMALALALLILVIYAWAFLRNSSLQGLYAIVGIVGVPFVPVLLSKLTGRGNVFVDLFGEGNRLAATWNYLQSVQFEKVIVGEGLGMGTSLSWTLRGITGVQPIPSFDQLLGSILVQGGFILLLPTLAFIISPLLRYRYRFLTLTLPLLTIAAAIAIPLWETWPANIIILALFGYISKNESIGSNESGKLHPSTFSNINKPSNA